MERRLIIAIALSLLVLLIWSALTPKPQLIDRKEVTEEILAPAPLLLVPSAGQATRKEPSSASLFKFSTKKYEVTFIEPQAAIKGLIFKSYQNYNFPLQLGFLLDNNELVFHKESITSEGVSFVYKDKDKEISKRFIFTNSNYTIVLEIGIKNLSRSDLRLAFPLVIGTLNLQDASQEARFKDITLASKEKITHLAPRKNIFFEEVRFLGLRDRYFTAIIQPAREDYGAFINKINNQEFDVGLQSKEITILPNQQIEQKFNIYLGPQELKEINSINPEWTAVMYYGVFDFIAHILLQLLDILYGLVHNWGLVIVILSIGIYFLLYPLTLKQMHSMRQMQALQPLVEELTKRYKDNPQKLNIERMKLYRDHKINPLSGCLPLILQMPLFFVLYQVLMRSVSLKGANFLWIKDLSLADRLFILPVTLPILGNEINILPILMAIGMFVQQKFSMSATSGGSAEQQKIMLIVMPLMFGFIFYHMPAGLVLYWFINSALMLIYQLRVSLKK